MHIPLVGEMMAAVADSVERLRGEFYDIQPGPLAGPHDTITFRFRGKAYIGYLRGRKANYLIGFGQEQDRAIALMCWIDQDYREIT